MLKLGTVVEFPEDRSHYGVVTDPEVDELHLSAPGLGNILVEWFNKKNNSDSYLWWEFEDSLEVVDTD